MKLKDKVVIITGGSSGIGKSISQRFQEEGAKVCVLDLNVAEEPISSIDFYKTDVSRQASVLDSVQAILSKFQRIDLLINNAGISHIGTASSTTEADFDKIYEVNIRGVYNCLHAVLPQMEKQKSGIILNMCSIAAHVGISDRFAYSASKGAVLAMTYSVAKDYLKAGVRCNSISPARVHTPFVDDFIRENYPGQEAEVFKTLSESQPLGRMGNSEEVASLALFLCSEESAFITGTDFPLDGGFIKLNS